jgi:hypothetical protein
MVSCVAQDFSQAFLKRALESCAIATNARSWEQFERCFSISIARRFSVIEAQAGTL